MLCLRSTLLCLAVAAAARADDTATLARLVPANTPFYLETQSATPEEVKGLAMTACLQEPTLKAALQRLVGADDAITSRMLPVGPAGIVLKADLQALAVELRYVDRMGEHTVRLKERFALALVGVVQGPLPVDAVVAIESDDAAALMTILRRLTAAISISSRQRRKKQGGIDAELQQIEIRATHRDIDYSILTLHGISLYVAPLGRLVVLATTEDRIKDCIHRHLDGPQGSLAEDPRHAELVAHAKGTGTATSVMTLHVDRTLDVLQPAFGFVVLGVRGYLQRVGLGGLKSITSVARVDGRGITSTTSILLDGERRGLGRLFSAGKPATFSCLDFAPKEALYVNCGNFDIAGLYEIFLEAGGAAVAPSAEAFMKSRFGVDLKKDLIGLLGPEAGIVIAPNRGLIPDVGIIFESKDPDRLARTVAQFFDAMDWPVGTGLQRAKIGGVKAYVAPLGHPKLANFPIAPSFGVVDGRFLIAPSPLSFQRFLAIQRGERENITANRDFAKLRAHVPEGALGISYFDLPRAVEFFYDTAVPLMQSFPQHKDSAPIYELPDVRSLTRHLYGRIGWRVADERGMHWGSHSPFDLGGITVGMAAGVAGSLFYVSRSAPDPVVIAAPVPADGRDPHRLAGAEARMCRNRVRLLRARIRLYRRDNDGKFPKAIDDLKAAHVSAETFIVPGTKKKYVYRPMGPGGVLLHGFPNGQDERICVLFRDLSMKRLTAEELRELLRPQSASTGR